MTWITDYSSTPASNNSASPNGMPEGMAPSGVNDSWRESMARVRGHIAIYTAGGSADAQTVTLAPAPSAYAADMEIWFTPVADNTGACTLNANSLGTKSIKLINGNDPFAGDIDASGMCHVKYDGTNFVLLNPATPSQIVGSYTGTLTGCTTSPTETLRYIKIGDTVVLHIPSLTAASNTTACTITGMPSDIQPTRQQECIGRIQNASTTPVYKPVFVETDGTLTLSNGLNTSQPVAFTNSLTKGWRGGVISYLLT